MDDVIERIQNEKDKLRDDIEDIQEELSSLPSLEEVREKIDNIRHTMRTGEIPEGDSMVAGVERVSVNPETGRPRRGAREQQIRQAIDVISDQQETFKAREVFELLQKADPEISESQRAYLYSKLGDLREKGELEKIKRGVWKKK